MSECAIFWSKSVEDEVSSWPNPIQAATGSGLGVGSLFPWNMLATKKTGNPNSMYRYFQKIGGYFLPPKMDGV